MPNLPYRSTIQQESAITRLSLLSQDVCLSLSLSLSSSSADRMAGVNHVSIVSSLLAQNRVLNAAVSFEK